MKTRLAWLRAFWPRSSRDAARLRASGLFDESWYLAHYPDVAAAGMDPVEHYLRFGAAEGRNPGPRFYTRAYLDAYADVRASGMNPLLHFAVHGRAEGRNPEGSDYALWIERYDSWRTEDFDALRRGMRAFTKLARFSVILPVYNTEARWLERAIESVIAQVYPHWDLCISDNASTQPQVREVMERYARRDARIRLAFRASNDHISANSNTALALARGEYIALLDADDELAPQALFWAARAIDSDPAVDLLYTDEDKIGADGRRFDPYFKPGWNPALLLSQNYFSHLGIYRRALVERVGGFRLGLEGSQDHDLVLRCAELTEPARIRHIPRVLYHWRALPGSTASVQGIDAKPYARPAGLRAIEDHLARRGIAGTVVPALSQYYQVDYQLRGKPPKVSIVMPSACKLHLLRPCMAALLKRTTYADFEVLLAVNETRLRVPEQADYLRNLERDPRVRLLVYGDRPFNFSWINNWAAAQARGSILCLMNDDVEVRTPDWLERLAARLQLEGVGAVGVLLHYPDGRIQHAGVTLGLGGVAGHTYIGLAGNATGYFGRAQLEQDLSCVTAACMALRREAFEAVGGLNESLAIAFNDVDLCIRLRRAGWRILLTPQVAHIHHESASIGRHDSPDRQEEFAREVGLMRTLWADVLDHDPFHNPNLSLSHNNVALAFPPRIAKLPGEPPAP